MKCKRIFGRICLLFLSIIICSSCLAKFVEKDKSLKNLKINDTDLGNYPIEEREEIPIMNIIIDKNHLI